jgi:type IV pilus assembly protein PilM
MLLLLPSSQLKRRSQVVAIDLGMRATKAVSFRRSGDRLELLRYTCQQAPGCNEKISTSALAAHLKQVMDALGAKTRLVIFIAGVNDCLLRHAELPLMAADEMRTMLRLNSKNYVQQDLSDYVLDCYILPPSAGSKAAEVFKPNGKCRVLVGGAKKQFLDDLQAAAKEAGLVAEQIAPNLITTANAFEMAHPEEFQNEAVALVDIGFRNSTISILLKGELLLSRVVAIGGDKLTSGLSEALNISYDEAEGIKIGMPEEVQSAMLPLLTPLGRELRASVDFFEHQQDKAVSQVMVSGGSARSRFIIEALQSELMVPCQTWNPLRFADQALTPEQKADVDQLAPELVVATGGAFCAL